MYVSLNKPSSSLCSRETLISKKGIVLKVVEFAPQMTEGDNEIEDDGKLHAISTCTEVKDTNSRSNLSGVFETINTAADTQEGETSLAEIYESEARRSSGSATSVLVVEKRRVVQTPRAQSTRAVSDATTLRESVSRYESASTYGAAFMPEVDFRKKSEHQRQLLAELQGQRDRVTVQKNQEDEEDRSIRIDAGPQRNDENGETNTLEEQAKIYDALLEKAKQDGEDALAAQKDEYDDTVKDLRKDFEAAESRKVMFEKRLRKVLGEQKTKIDENLALSERCNDLRDDVAHKDEQIAHMSSALQNHQQELDGLRGLYENMSAKADESARLVEENGITMHNLRQTIHRLTNQLTLSGQPQRAPSPALIDSLRSENGRLLGILAENEFVLEAARARITSLTQAMSQAKRENDRWTDNQLTGCAEDSLSNPTKIANHIAYKNKLYEDLEKRFLEYSTNAEAEQQKASDEKEIADKSITTLREVMDQQEKFLEDSTKLNKKYQEENVKMLRTVLGQMPQDEFIEGLSFHFDLVRNDNAVLAARVLELDKEVTDLKQEVVRHKREQESLVKELKANQKIAHQLEEAKEAAMGELDALKYSSEVAEEGHKEEIENYRNTADRLSSKLRVMSDNFSALNRESASERIQALLDSKDELIDTLEAKLNETYQALIQASNERDHYYRVTELDNCVNSFHERDVTFLQHQLRIAEAKFTELSEPLSTGHLQRIREAREYKEAFEAEKVRVEKLEKELHELYQNLQGQGSHTPADAPPHASTSQSTEDRSGAIEDLAIDLWGRMRGLEGALKALGNSIIEPKDEREEIRITCEKSLGLREGEEFGTPKSTASVEDAEEGDADNDVPDSDEGGANNQDAQQEDERAHAQRIIHAACDALGYTPDDPRRILEDMRTVEETGAVEEGEESGQWEVLEEGERFEGSEDAAGLRSSTEAVLGDDDDEQNNLEDEEEFERGAVPGHASHRTTDDEGGDTTATSESEPSSGNEDDDKTVTQAEYNAAALRSPERATAESYEDADGQSPPDEGDPDDSLNMTPKTWARRYDPVFMYGEPVGDDIF